MTQLPPQPPNPELETTTGYHFRLKDILLGAQMLFVAFGALVLVPILAGLDPNVALLTSGVGTLCFQAVTKKSGFQAPSFTTVNGNLSTTISVYFDCGHTL